MLIAVSGLARSGKNTVTDRLAARLRAQLVRASHKDVAARRHMDVLVFERTIRGAALDKELDAWTVAEAKKHKRCVVDAMLSGWLLPNADLRVWLYATDEVRAGRAVTLDPTIKKADALRYIGERDRVFRNRIKKVYGIDWWDPKWYDIMINTGGAFDRRPDAVVDVVVAAIKARKR